MLALDFDVLPAIIAVFSIELEVSEGGREGGRGGGVSK
jgi:hypothetical protein